MSPKPLFTDLLLCFSPSEPAIASGHCGIVVSTNSPAVQTGQPAPAMDIIDGSPSGHRHQPSPPQVCIVRESEPFWPLGSGARPNGSPLAVPCPLVLYYRLFLYLVNHAFAEAPLAAAHSLDIHFFSDHYRMPSRGRRRGLHRSPAAFLPSPRLHFYTRAAH
jgi:hypothetical protein